MSASGDVVVCCDDTSGKQGRLNGRVRGGREQYEGGGGGGGGGSSEIDRFASRWGGA